VAAAGFADDAVARLAEAGLRHELHNESLAAHEWCEGAPTLPETVSGARSKGTPGDAT
jgi:hypothetical protein